MYPFHHPPKIWCGRGDLHAHAPSGAAVFETARSTFHARPQNGRGGRGCTGTDLVSPAGFKPAVSSHSNHAAIELVRTEGVAPSRACARRLLGPARLLFRHVRKMDPARRFALRSSPYQEDASLPTLCRQSWSRREDLHLRSPGDGAFTARCNCCSATPRNWGLGRDLHPHRHGV